MPLTHNKSNDNNWVVILGGQPFIFDHTHPHYSSLIQCVKIDDADGFVKLYNTGHVVEDWSDGEFEFKDGFLYFDGEQVDREPTNRIIECITQDFPHQPILSWLTTCTITSVSALFKSLTSGHLTKVYPSRQMV